MVDVVETLIVKLGVQGAEKLPAAGKAIDAITIATEKMDKAVRASEQRWTNIVGKVEPAVRSISAFGKATKILDDYQSHGIGTAAEYALVTESMVNKLLKGVGTAEQLGRSFEDLTASFDPATSSVEHLESVFGALSAGINTYVKNSEIAKAATELLATSFNRLSIQTEASQRNARAWQANRQGVVSQELVNNAGRGNQATLVNTDDVDLDPRVALPKRDRQNARTLARGADVQEAFGGGLDNLRAKYDQLFAAGLKYKNLVAEIRHDASLVAGGENLVGPAITKAKTEFAQQVRDIRGVTAAADAQKLQAAAAQKYLDTLNPLLPLQREYIAELKEIASLRESGHLSRPDAVTLAGKATDTFEAKSRKATGRDEADRKAAEEQTRLNAATQTYLDMLDPTADATRKYAAALGDLNALQEKGKLSSLGAAVVEAKLTTEYEKQIRVLTGVAEAERKAGEAKKQGKADAQAAETAQLRLADDAQKYIDQLNPLLPLERAHNKELERLADLVKANELTPKQAAQSADLATKKFDFAKATAPTTAITPLKQASQDIKDRLDPAAATQRNYANALARVNALHAAGELDAKEFAAAIKLVDSDLKRGTLSTRGMQFALTNLSFQVNDVATGLLSGQQPFRIFAQQAGQFVQVFQQGGGVGKVLGDASTWLRSMITPMNAAIAGLAGLAVGFGLVVAKAIELSSRARTFDVALRGFGTAGLASAGDLEKSIKDLREYGLTADEAQKAVERLARTPTVNPRSAASIAKTGADLGAIRGSGVEGGVDELVSAIKEGPEGLIKLGVELGKIGPKETEHIRRIKETTGTVAALDEAFKLLSIGIGGSLPNSISQAKKAWNDLQTAFSNALEGPASNTAIKFILDDLAKIPKGIEDSLREILRIIDLVKKGMDFINSAKDAVVEKVSFSPAQATDKATSARRDMDTALAERDRTSGGTGLVPGTERFDATGIKGNTEALLELKVVMAEASRSLPQGYSLVATSGQRDGKGGSLHNTGDAIDIQIKAPSGFLPNKGPIGSDPGMYKDLAIAAWQANQKLFPGKELTWGREFETEKGSGLEDWMHFDRGPHRGQLAPALSTIAGRATSTSASAADAGRAVPATDSTFQPDRNKIDEAAKAYRILNRDQDAATEAAKKFGIEQQVLQAYTQKYNEAIDAGREPWQARDEAEKVATETHKRAIIELQKESQVQEMTTEGISKSADAFKISSAAGYRAQAAEDARREAVLKGLGASEKSGFVVNRTRQILEEQAATAVRSAHEQTAAAQPQLLAAEKLADATSHGIEAGRQQDIANRATLKTQDALAKAEASRNPILIAQAKAATDAALADEKRADAAERARRGFEAANDNRLTSQQVQFETKIVASGLSPAEQTRQLAYFDALQHAAKEFSSADAEPKVKAARDAYLETAKAVADNKYQLTLVQREQERWNNLVSDLANTIENELSRSIENAFSEEKVESWGKRINRWLGTISSSLSSSLFIKPALGTLAGALGFGTAAASLGSFGSIGSLLGTGGSSSGATSGGSATITKNEDGTLSLSNLASGASLINSATGSGGGLLSSLNAFGSKIGFATPTSALSTSEISSLGDLIGIDSKSLGFLSEPGTISGSLFGSTTLSSALGGIGAGFGAGSLLNSLLGGTKLGGTVGSGAGAVAGTALGSLVGMPILGGIIGGAAGGGLGGLFGQTHKRANASGLSIDLGTGAATKLESSGSAENDKTTKQIRDDLTDFTKTLQSTTKGTLSGYVNPQATDQGIKLDYNIEGYGSGTYSTKDSQDAIDTAELAIARGLTGITDNMKKVIDQVTDPTKLDAAIKFANTYDKIADAAKDAFSSIPSDIQTEGPFAKAKDDIKTTFDDIEADAEKFGLALKPVTDALDEANKRLTKDFDRYIKDLTTAVEDPLQSLVDIEKRAGDARLKDAKEVNGNILAVNKYNAIALTKIWDDSTKSIKEFQKDLKSGEDSGLTATQRLKTAQSDYDALLTDVKAGKSSKFEDFVTAGKSLYSLSTTAYGQGPKTATLRKDLLAALDGVLASRSFASGTKATPPGVILVGEQGPELIAQPGGLKVHNTREVQKIVSVIAPVSGPMSSSNSNLSLVTNSNSSAAAQHNSSSISVKNIVAAIEKAAPARAFAEGTKATPGGTILVGEKGPELIARPDALQTHPHREAARMPNAMSPSGNPGTTPLSGGVKTTERFLHLSSSSAKTTTSSLIDREHARAFAEGTRATPPGMILVGERGPELISQPGGLQVYPHRETERILTRMRAANDDHRAFASGTMATPPGTILVGEQGRELMGLTQGRAFADGTDGRLYDWMVYQGNGVAGGQGQHSIAATVDLSDVEALLNKQLAEMKANTEISRLGHLETGRKVDKQTDEMKKPALYEPKRRKVAA